MSPYRLGETLFIRTVHELAVAEIAAWDALLQSCPDLQRAFLSRTYIAAVARTGRKVVVLVGYIENVPVFFLPLQRKAGWLGKFGLHEPAGDVMTDYFGIVAAKEVRIELPDLLKATRGAINAVFFTHLDETQSNYGLTANEYRTGLRTWLGDPPQNYWSNLRKIDKKLVYDTERREKKLVAECGPLTFEWSSTHPESDLDWLIESKKSQYSRTGKEQAPLFDPANSALLLNLLHTQDTHCRGLLSVLRCGDTIVAAHFGLHIDKVLHVWFPVYDTRFANYSPGRILFKHMFTTGAEQGVTRFDRGEGDNQAKRDFSNEEHRFGRGVWYAGHMRGRLAYLAQRLAWKLG